MPSSTNEQALETAIEKTLTGHTRETLKQQGIGVAEAAQIYRAGNGYWMGDPADFDAEYAVDTRRFWHFLETTQPTELAKLKSQHQWQLKIVQQLDKLIKKYGLLYVLRKGLAVDDAHFTLLYVPPLASSSPSVAAAFERNEFSLTRQVRYSTANTLQTIDMVVFISGLPVATIELKNAWTGQTARVHGIKQYKFDRDATQPLLTFGRCLVHFAVDTDEVYMTTRLSGSQTVFLPFNQGADRGAGNPPNLFGHKTAYLWEDMLTRQTLSALVLHYVTMDGKPTDPLAKRRLVFPRYHQIDVVRKLLAHTSQNGVGHTYLIQHSAGSGKSHSITWSAFQLIENYPASGTVPGSRNLNHPLFDSVIVVTDRRVLDRQISDNIREFSQVKNIVAHAHSSQELRLALESGKRIIITTIQKFPFIIDGIADLSDKRFAVIIDEAHSSQSGSAHDSMNHAMGKTPNPNDDDEPDAQDLILAAMQHRKMRGNASYFAFTATPKATTLEKFGHKQPDGTYRPFHLYSMKQAIEEGFILDVLANYNTYKSYYEIEKSIQENPLFDTQKAQKKLRAYVEQHRQTIQTKAEIMVEHFMTQVVNPKKLKGKAKGMVVTQNIQSAIRYYVAIRAILADKQAPFQVLVAFSGKKIMDGYEYTEANLNGFSETQTAERFDTDAYRLLVVANKYLTGFDQPKLSAMYVDKKLQGVMAVQALSRLNRAAADLGKKTEDLFILDFFNTTDDIKAAFDPFYTATSLSGATDVNVLHELKAYLGDVGVYEEAEVEEFVEKYFNGVDAQKLSPLIDRAAHRFTHDLGLEGADKVDFKIKAKQFVKIYGQTAAIMPFEIVGWEKLFWFLKFLIPKLAVRDAQADALDALLESVDLSTYGLERTKLSHAIELDNAEAEVDPQNPNPRGAHNADAEKDPLDEIISRFNERHFQGWSATPEEQRVKFINILKYVQQQPNYKTHVVDNVDKQNSELALAKMINEAISQQRKSELELYKLYSQDMSFKQAMQDTIRRMLRL